MKVEEFGRLTAKVRFLSEEELKSRFNLLLPSFVSLFQRLFPEGEKVALRTLTELLQLCCWNGSEFTPAKRAGIRALLGQIIPLGEKDEEFVYIEPEPALVRELMLCLIVIRLRAPESQELMPELMLLLSKAGEESLWAVNAITGMNSSLESMNREELLSFIKGNKG